MEKQPHYTTFISSIDKRVGDFNNSINVEGQCSAPDENSFLNVTATFYTDTRYTANTAFVRVVCDELNILERSVNVKNTVVIRDDVSNTHQFICRNFNKKPLNFRLYDHNNLLLMNNGSTSAFPHNWLLVLKYTVIE